MRLAFVTDLHVTESRIDEHVLALKTARRAIVSQGVDLVLIGGDLTGLRCPHRATPTERNAVVDFLADLERVAPVIVARGNHDALGDWDFLNAFRGSISYIDEPEAIIADEWGVMVLPWVDRSEVPKGKEYGPYVRIKYRDAIAELLGDTVRPHLFVLSHAAIAGAMIRDGQPLTPSNDPILKPSDLCRPPFEAAFVGHYHLPQDIEGGPIPGWYGGSLCLNDFGEPGPRGWLTYDTETGRPEWSNAGSPIRIKVVLDASGKVVEVSPGGVTVELDPFRLDPGFATPGAHLRLVIRMREGQAADAARVARPVLKLVDGKTIRSVRVDYEVEREVVQREGADRVARAVDLPGKVEAYLSQLDPRPDKADCHRVTEILAKVCAEIFVEEAPF